MLKRFTRKAATFSMVAALGFFFIGCSFLSNTSKDQNIDPESREYLEDRLNEVNEQLEQENDEPDLYYRKAILLNELAYKLDSPEARNEYYRDMRENLLTAESHYSRRSDNSGLNKVKELLQISWSNEHNQGVEILQTDSTLADRELEKAAIHFGNAITIIPDSIATYSLKARAHYKIDQQASAISTLENARKHAGNLPPQLLEQLAYLYLEDENPEMAIRIYEEAESFSSDNLNLLHGLANAYIQANDHEKASQLLKRLVENDPDNALYRQTYGNELYYLGAKKIDLLLVNQTSGDEDLLSDARSDLEDAGEQLKRAYSLKPQNKEIKQNLAFFHQNFAIQLKKIIQFYSNADSSVIEQEIRDQLNESIPILEELVNNNPGNKEYWQNLYQAYTYLGLSEKADEAREKANL